MHKSLHAIISARCAVTVCDNFKRAVMILCDTRGKGILVGNTITFFLLQTHELLPFNLYPPACPKAATSHKCNNHSQQLLHLTGVSSTLVFQLMALV